MATSSRENLLKDGVLASSGKSFITALILRCASVKRKLTSAPVFNVIITTETLSIDFVSIFFTFSKDDTASSITFETEVSTSDGAAPG
ncbi:hypothetical protein D3C87_1390020 [compost metagenome]